MLFVLIFGAFLFWQVLRFTIEAYVDNALFPTFIRVRLIEVYWVGPIGVAEFLLTAFGMLLRRLRAKPEAFAKLPAAQPTTLSEGGV
jgi:hypothetical protein